MLPQQADPSPRRFSKRIHQCSCFHAPSYPLRIIPCFLAPFLSDVPPALTFLVTLPLKQFLNFAGSGRDDGDVAITVDSATVDSAESTDPSGASRAYSYGGMVLSGAIATAAAAAVSLCFST